MSLRYHWCPAFACFSEFPSSAPWLVDTTFLECRVRGHTWWWEGGELREAWVLETSWSTAAKSVLDFACMKNKLIVYSLNSVRLFCKLKDCSPPGSSVPGIFPGKNTEVGCHFLFQGIFQTQRWNLCLLHWQADSLPLSQREALILKGSVKERQTALIRKASNLRTKWTPVQR